MRQFLAKYIPVLGIALSTYLLLLKLFPQPCFGAYSCEKVLFSPYGSILSIPVSVFALLFWGLYLLRDTWQFPLRILATLATVMFMWIQFSVLRSFCLYCTLHALCVAALWVQPSTTKLLVYPVGLLSGILFFFVTNIGAHTGKIPHIAPQIFPMAEKVGLNWLSPQPKETLIISIDCPKCQDDIAKLWANPAGPSLVFRTTAENQAATEIFIAAILAQPNAVDAFPLIWSQWLPLHTLPNADKLFSTTLQQQNLSYQHKLGAARILLKKQQNFILKHNIHATPTSLPGAW